MRLLFDANLRPALGRHLQAEYPNSMHVRDVGLRTGSDAQIWEYAKANLVFEGIPVNNAQFESLLEMTRQLPDLKVVLNHMGNPPVPENGWEPWATQIARAAELSNMSVKLSAGLALVVRWTWSTDALRKYADHVIDLFSSDRVMAGSNWPVILLGASFVQAWRGLEDLIAGLSDAERHAILGGTARCIYGI